MAHGIKNTEKAKDGRRTFSRLMSYLSNYKPLLCVIVLLVLVSIASGLGGSYLLRPIINNYIIPGDIPGLARMIGVLLAVYLTGVAATFIQYRLLNIIGQKTASNIRLELFRKMERLPLNYFDTHQHGDLMSRFTNDMDKVSDVLTDNLADLISAALTVLGILIMMLYISPLLTLASLVTIPLMLLSVSVVVKRSKKHFRGQQASLGNLDGYIEEMISGQKVIKVFGHEKETATAFEQLNNDLKKKSEKAQLYSGLMMPLMQNLSTINFVVVTIAGALLAIYRGFDLGGLATFVQYSRQMGRPINDLATLYNNLQAAIAGAERIFAVLDQVPEPADTSDAIALTQVKGDIEFRNVTFGYIPDKTVLKNISTHITAGSKIALVGTTGAGKTTILNLLPRFYDIQSGEIRVDNTPITSIKRDDLRDLLAMVLQDTHLFTGTVYENLRFGRLDATNEEIVEAARLTSAHSFIKRLPQGYETMLENDGANLSQGQRQLLNIARAAVSNPSILLLDEATSNIDTRSEILIQAGLDKLMQGRTSIIIAHRLSTIKNADKILVIENGQVVESGTHAELLALSGHYSRLYENQFEEMQ